MAHNLNNWGFIATGQKIGVGYVINGGADFGAQFAQGSPENPGGNLITDSHEKILDPNGAVVYAFQLTNTGNDTFFALEGGGLSWFALHDGGLQIAGMKHQGGRAWLS